MPQQPRAVSRLLDQTSGPMARLRSRLDQFERNLALVRAQLPENLRPHLLGVRAESGQLLILVRSSLWATRLRYLEANLLEIWHGLGGEPCTRIRLRVSPDRSRPEHKPRRAKALSAANAHNLRTVADGVKDPALRAALQRLAAKTHG